MLFFERSDVFRCSGEYYCSGPSSNRIRSYWKSSPTTMHEEHAIIDRRRNNIVCNFPAISKSRPPPREFRVRNNKFSSADIGIFTKGSNNAKKCRCCSVNKTTKVLLGRAAVCNQNKNQNKYKPQHNTAAILDEFLR